MVGGPSTLNKMDPWEEFLLFSVILPMANAEQTRTSIVKKQPAKPDCQH
jgi:hypothetical protein